ncbi:hypothetical protein HU200_000042 [Digitaria exilis]|uniref:RING-type domain-containing protein n=1 Tax=Digitaria exilis TaxID=1010633 RepID=A0A835FZI1_9POAL|nr:hypothetical protein HU200_000042 [Digitaria exilis]
MCPVSTWTRHRHRRRPSISFSLFFELIYSFTTPYHHGCVAFMASTPNTYVNIGVPPYAGSIDRSTRKSATLDACSHSPQTMEPDALRARPQLLGGAAGGARRVVVEPPAAPHGDCLQHLADDDRLQHLADDESLAIYFNDVLYHNRMVEATHQQARRDMATQTEETIVAPELLDDGGGGGGCTGTTPASAAAVARLERRRHDGGGGTGDGDDDDGGAEVRCAICIGDFEVGDDLSVMPCSHVFHEGCIAKWLARSRLCPCCRHALPD